ncbi:MAG: hypothetical protein NT121_21140 [Chloroflexi bacterium]|nr:hypothetical protein [Chloroflexota bacterium]
MAEKTRFALFMRDNFRQLDFSLLPVIDYAGMIVRLDREVDERLRSDENLSEFYDRARSALMFFFLAKEDSERWRNDAMLRAGLNELYAMDAAARRGFKLAGRTGKPPTLAVSANPLVHLMYMLRHLNVHTKPSPSRIEEVTVIYRPDTVAQEMSYKSVMLDVITTSDILKNKENKGYYRVEDIDRILDWLMENQRIFGIAEVFQRGLHAYCREVMNSTETLHAVQISSGTAQKRSAP